MKYNIIIKSNPSSDHQVETVEPPSIRTNNHGFTLVEILIAICILTIALIGMASVTIMVTKQNTYSKQVTTATTLANDKIEQLKNVPYASLDNGGPEIVESMYSRSWTVSPSTNTTPPPDTTTINVSVTWSWSGQIRTIQLDTLVTRP